MASDDEIRAFNAMAARIESIEKAMNDHIVGIEAKMQALIQVFGLSVDQTLDWINLSKEFERKNRRAFGLPEPEE